MKRLAGRVEEPQEPAPGDPLVRVMPCETENCVESGAMAKNGDPYFMGRPPFGGFPMHVHCARCKRSMYVTREHFTRIPEVPLSSILERAS